MIHRFINGSIDDFFGNVFDLFGAAVEQRLELPSHLGSVLSRWDPLRGHGYDADLFIRGDGTPQEPFNGGFDVRRQLLCLPDGHVLHSKVFV